jgi:3,4-dihydroxy 2-butanone 4-phosphate synthase / GTP cyclohydrolase II
VPVEPVPGRPEPTPPEEGAALATVPELLAELRAGRPIIVVDDEDRENEGDLVFAAEHATPALLAFTIRHTGGIVCLALPTELADRLDLPPMVAHNTAKRETAFTVTIEAAEGITTGISAADRAHTIRLAGAPGAHAGDFARPGHVFPLRAREGGVLRRAGHTEAAVDLARLAGLRPVAALSEVMRDDGQMMRLPELRRFAAAHGLKIGTIADLIAYRLRGDGFVQKVARRGFRRPGPPSASSATATPCTTPSTWRWSSARSATAARRWCGCTRSASPATRCTACVATAASSATPLSR